MSEVFVKGTLVAGAVLVVAAAAYLGHRRERHAAGSAPLSLHGVGGSVLFFTDAACKRCDVMRDRLLTLGAAFDEIAYDREPEVHSRVGVIGVPLLVVRDNAGRVVDRAAGVVSLRRLARLLSHAG